MGIVNRIVALAPLAGALVLELAVNIGDDLWFTVRRLTDLRFDANEQAEWSTRRLSRRRALLKKVPGITVE